LEVTNIDVTAGTIVGIDYDIGVLGYCQMGGNNFTIHGYNWHMFAQGINPDACLKIVKVLSAGASKKFTFVELENLGVDSGAAGNQIVDNLRVGGDDRSCNPAIGQVWGDDTTFEWRQRDFQTYFASDENQIPAGDGYSGIYIEVVGEPPGAISNADYMVLQLRTSNGLQ